MQLLFTLRVLFVDDKPSTATVYPLDNQKLDQWNFLPLLLTRQMEVEPRLVYPLKLQIQTHMQRDLLRVRLCLSQLANQLISWGQISCEQKLVSGLFSMLPVSLALVKQQHHDC